MAAFDKIRQQLAKGNPVFEGAMLAGALTSSEGKARALANAVKDIAIWRLTPMAVTLGAAFMGVRGVVQGIVKDSGALEAAWQRMARLKLYQGQLEPLVGGIEAARAKLGELIVFANKFKLPLGEVVAAQRALEIMGRGALSSGRNLEEVRNIAKGTGTGISEAAVAYAQFHRELAGGVPVAQAARELENMGAISAQTVREAAALQEGGAGLTAVWQTVAAGMQATTKTTRESAESIGELQHKLENARDVMAAAFGKPFLESEAKGIQNAIVIAQNLTPVMETLGKTFASVTTMGEGITGTLKRWGSMIPGLAPAVGFLAKGFVLLGAGFSAAGLIAGARALWMVGAAALEAARGLSMATVASTLYQRAAVARLAAINATTAGDLLAARAHHLYAATLIRGAGAATAMGNATAAAGGKVRTFFAGLVSNPIGLIVVAITAVLAALWQWNERIEQNKKAVKELQDANDQMQGKLTKQIKDIKSVDDAQQALIDSTNALAEARKKLAAIDVVIKAGGKATQAQLDAAGVKDAGEAKATRTEAGRNVRGLAATRGDIASRLGGYHRDYMAPSSGMEEVARNRARVKLGLDQQQRDFAIERASGSDKVAKIRAEADRKAGMVNEGAQYAMETAHWADREKEAVGDKGKLAGIAAAKRESKSELIRGEQWVQDMRDLKDRNGSPVYDGKAIAAAQQQITLRREEVQANSDPRAVAALREQANNEERMTHLRQIGLDAAREEAALRSEGMKRAEEEAAIRIQAAQKEIEAALARGDTQGAEAARNRALAEAQGLALAHKRAAIERAADASHLRVLALEQRSAGLALAGRFAESDAAKKAALTEADAQANRESYRQKTLAGYAPADARAAVGREQAQRAGGRALQAEAFRQSEGRQLTQRELARGLRPGDLEKGQRMADEDTVRGYLRKAQVAGIYGAEASDFARRSAAADIHDQVQGARASAPAIVSSLARIGGGGNVSTNNFNALKEETVRQRQLLEIIAENTKNPAGAGRIK